MDAAAVDRLASLNACGTLTYCQFVVRGVVRVAQVLVVVPGPCQTVIAAPIGCAIAKSGEWADNTRELADSDAHISFSCACTLEAGGLMCLVVFYSVDSRALDCDVTAGAIMFNAAGDQCGLPTHQSLTEAYYGEAEKMAELIQTGSKACSVIAPDYSHFEVRLAECSTPFFKNSVFVIPDLMTQGECDVLIDAADRHFVTTGLRAPTERMPICELSSADAENVSMIVLRDRVLPFLEQNLPEVASALFGQMDGLKDMSFVFTSREPAINRYMTGGGFQTHRDRKSVTVNVLLSPPKSFVGGGTAFWPEKSPTCTPSVESDRIEMLLQPRQCTAVIFNGDVEHSGKPVLSGVRHLYVASFNLEKNGSSKGL